MPSYATNGLSASHIIERTAMDYIESILDLFEDESLRRFYRNNMDRMSGRELSELIYRSKAEIQVKRNLVESIIRQKPNSGSMQGYLHYKQFRSSDELAIFPGERRRAISIRDHEGTYSILWELENTADLLASNDGRAFLVSIVGYDLDEFQNRSYYLRKLNHAFDNFDVAVSAAKDEYCRGDVKPSYSWFRIECWTKARLGPEPEQGYDRRIMQGHRLATFWVTIDGRAIASEIEYSFFLDDKGWSRSRYSETYAPFIPGEVLEVDASPFAPNRTYRVMAPSIKDEQHSDEIERALEAVIGRGYREHGTYNLEIKGFNKYLSYSSINEKMPVIEDYGLLCSQEPYSHYGEKCILDPPGYLQEITATRLIS